MNKQNDPEYKDEKICSVKSKKGYWLIKLKHDRLFWIDKKRGVEPRVGDIARFYGKGNGFPVRGLDIIKRCFYRTPKQDTELRRQRIRAFR